MNKRLIVATVSSVVLLALVWGGSGQAAGMPRQRLMEVEKMAVMAPAVPFAVSYEGCSESQQTALGNALTGIGTTLGTCGIGAELKECLNGKTQNVTIKCGGGDCDTEPRLAGQAPIGGTWVRICPRTFDNSQRLEAVLFHELVHSCNRGEKTAEACQNKCYDGRGATPPDEGEEGVECYGSPGRSPLPALGPAAPQQPLIAQLTTASGALDFVWREPITIVFELRNPDPTNVITVSRQWYNPSLNTLSITGPDGLPVQANILWEVEPPDASNYVALQPGGVLSDTFVITYEAYNLVPGPQMLQVHYTNSERYIYTSSYPYLIIGDANAWMGMVSSNVLLIQIHPWQRIYLPMVRRG